MKIYFSYQTSVYAYASYRAGVACDRLSGMSRECDQRAAVRWAMAWLRLAEVSTKPR